MISPAHSHRVECGTREKLQQPRPSPGCPRRNGYFYTVDNSCNSYVECRDGAPQSYACSTGLVYSLDLLSCVHPAQSGRQNCIDGLRDKEFQCPQRDDSSPPLR